MTNQQRRNENDRRAQQDRRGEESSMLEALAKEVETDRRTNENRREATERRN
jgi:hypothetical protein